MPPRQQIYFEFLAQGKLSQTTVTSYNCVLKNILAHAGLEPNDRDLAVFLADARKHYPLISDKCPTEAVQQQTLTAIFSAINDRDSELYASWHQARYFPEEISQGLPVRQLPPIIKCAHPECEKTASYNLTTVHAKDAYPKWCSAHRDPRHTEIPITPRVCDVRGCRHPVTYVNDVDQSYVCFSCEWHLVGHGFDVRKRSCDAPGCYDHGGWRYGRTGFLCFDHRKKETELLRKNPQLRNNPPINRHTRPHGYKADPDMKHAKEDTVRAFISQRFPSVEWITNKMISGSCKEKPDMRAELDTHIVIVEVDETQHYYTPPHKELERLEKIQEACEKPVIAIRFNPDSYTDDRGKYVQSCWSYTKDHPYVDDLDKSAWEKRLALLAQEVEKALGKDPGESVTQVHICYDGAA